MLKKWLTVILDYTVFVLHSMQCHSTSEDNTIMLSVYWFVVFHNILPFCAGGVFLSSHLRTQEHNWAKNNFLCHGAVGAVDAIAAPPLKQCRKRCLSILVLSFIFDKLHFGMFDRGHINTHTAESIDWSQCVWGCLQLLSWCVSISALASGVWVEGWGSLWLCSPVIDGS